MGYGKHETKSSEVRPSIEKGEGYVFIGPICYVLDSFGIGTTCLIHWLLGCSGENILGTALKGDVC